MPTRILSLGKPASLYGWVLRYRNGQPETVAAQQRIDENVTTFQNIFGANLTDIDIRMRGSDNSHVTSRSTRSAVDRRDELAQYTDVIIDISAMPRTVALTAIAQVIALLDEIANARTFDQPARRCRGECFGRPYVGAGSLSDTVTSLVGFSGRLTAESSANVPRVWFPVLGEGQAVRIQLNSCRARS